MKFTVETSDLTAAVSTVVKAMGSKTTVSILEGIYIEAIGTEVLFKCTDLTLQIETIIAGVVEEDGACVLPGRLFSEIVRRLPENETVFTSSKNSVIIESGRSRTTMQSDNPKDFMSMPDVRNDFSVVINKSGFKDMIKQCIFATAQDDSKPILTGVLLEIEGGDLSMVALDGFRLALRRSRIKSHGETRNVIVPARCLMEIGRILDDGDGNVDIVFSKTHIMIDMGHTRINTRLMDGEFIQYKKILPTDHETRVCVNREELLESIDRVSLMARENKKNHIKFFFSGNQLTITANSEIGSSKEEIFVNGIGNDLEIAFNAKYFSDVLKVLDDDSVYLDLNNSVSPCVVAPVINNLFYYLILPVRLFNGI